MNDVTAMSNKTKDRMRKTIAKMDASELEGVETLEDSINAAISYNLKTDDALYYRRHGI